MIRIGSLFSGIGGFELGLERAIPESNTIWQVEQNKYCQRVLKKHWPDALIYDDVCSVGKHNLKPVDIICGGFPCQDISTAGKQGGIHAKKSGLWWEMFRIISELRPRVAVLENVPNLITLGLSEVLGSLASIGYDSEWCIISAKQFGAPHLRKRVFIVAYSSSSRGNGVWIPFRLQKKPAKAIDLLYRTGAAYWEKTKAPAPVCRVHDGVSNRLDRLRALGNAIVPQCSEWIGQKIWDSGLLVKNTNGALI